VSPMAISWIVFACVFAGALFGMFLRAKLPEPHLSAKSEDVLKMLAGLVGTMAALVIGLLIATAASSYSTRRTELMQASANIVLLDRVLARYGPDTKEARDQLGHAVVGILDTAWPKNRTAALGNLDRTANRGEVLYDTIQQLEPRNDVQRSLKAQALTMVINLAQTRWLLIEQSGSSIPIPFVVVLAFWLAIIFACFGIFAPPNATMLVALFLGALSVSGAIFLILELDQPFGGVIQLSSAPLRNALAHLGK
jgi:hypothetical protein